MGANGLRDTLVTSGKINMREERKIKSLPVLGYILGTVLVNLKGGLLLPFRIRLTRSAEDKNVTKVLSDVQQEVQSFVCTAATREHRWRG